MKLFTEFWPEWASVAAFVTLCVGGIWGLAALAENPPGTLAGTLPAIAAVEPCQCASSLEDLRQQIATLRKRVAELEYQRKEVPTTTTQADSLSGSGAGSGTTPPAGIATAPALSWWNFQGRKVQMAGPFTSHWDASREGGRVHGPYRKRRCNPDGTGCRLVTEYYWQPAGQ